LEIEREADGQGAALRAWRSAWRQEPVVVPAAVPDPVSFRIERKAGDKYYVQCGDG
jgi:hypothetical protein